jgi:LmbE family N-acetylglucosaminyl deacetylase
MDGVPFPFVAQRDDEIDAIIDVSEYARQKLMGILCHRTQLGPDNSYVNDPEGTRLAPHFCEEAYVLADSPVGRSEEQEDDLFRGIDPSAQA